MRSPLIKQILMFGIFSGVISLLLACISFGIVEFYKIKDASTVKLQSQMDLLAYNLQPTLVFDDKEAAYKILRFLKEDKAVTRAALYKPDGRLYASYGSPGHGDIRIGKNIIYRGRSVGRLVMESVYLGLWDKYMSYALISLIIMMITIPALFVISAPIRRQVSDGVMELEQQSNRLRQLADQVATTEQRERKRIAALIHDHLQQILAASKLQMDLALRRHKNGEHPQVEAKLTHSINLLNEASAAARSLTVELRPPVLYEAGLGEAFKWLAHKFKADHNLEVALDVDEVPGVLSDNLKILIFESVKELLFNVVKYAGVPCAQLYLRHRASLMIISVKDLGRGFDMESIEAVSSTQGFGLFSIRERIKLLKGSFRVVSQPRHGTEIEMTIPVDKILDSASGELGGQVQGPASSSRQRRKRINILLVDDHKIVREGLANLLKENDSFNVVAQAENGAEAVEKTGLFHPDIVIMDINMPKLNGIEATRVIKSKYRDVSIIGLSVQDERDVAESMRKAGAVTLVNKAGDPQQLVQTILLCARGKT